ncbi:hypothetical protein CcCBS67573_g04901 [Chytriomyces confervae]|uniref:Uncharacterized protein n=1 Tax=Chytriomyces confervae TaxID=246404 RepID=A0A507FE12_9FUNG|nr:hypothetical protein CcCBS67573_g04901 [Chytriomyces confervae]
MTILSRTGAAEAGVDAVWGSGFIVWGIFAKIKHWSLNQASEYRPRNLQSQTYDTDAYERSRYARRRIGTAWSGQVYDRSTTPAHMNAARLTVIKQRICVIPGDAGAVIKRELQKQLAMSKFQSAVIILVALSAVAVVATAAARFTSPAKTPKEADRRNSKRKLSNRETRAPPEESQALPPAETADIIYLPQPVFIRSDHIPSFNENPFSEIPIHIPVPIFQNTQGYALSQTGANETSDCITDALVSGPAGATQQPHQGTFSEVSATESCGGSVNILYSLDHDVAQVSKIHILLTSCGPSQIRQIQYAAAVITPTPMHNTTAKTAPMRITTPKNDIHVHQNLETVQPQIVCYSPDKHELSEASKFTDVRFSSGPNQVRQIAYAFVDVQQKSASTETVVTKAAAPKSAPQEERFSLSRHEIEATRPIISGPSGIRQIPFAPSSPAAVPAIKSQPISSIVPVKSTDVPLFALSSSDFDISQIYITDMLATGPLSIRQIPYASESVPSKTAIQVPVATCNSNAVEKTAEKKKDEKKEEKKEGKKEAKKEAKKEEKKEAKIEAKEKEKKEDKKEEKKEEKKEDKCVAKVEKAEAKAVAQTSSGPMKSAAIVEQPLSSTGNVVASKMVAPKLEKACAMASQPQSHTESMVPEPVHSASHSSAVFIPVSPDLSAGSSRPVFLGSDPAEVHYAFSHTNSRSNRSHGTGLNPYAAAWEPSSVASVKGLNPFAPIFQPTASKAFDGGYETLNSGLNKMQRPQYPNEMEKVAAPAADAIVPKFASFTPNAQEEANAATPTFLSDANQPTQTSPSLTSTAPMHLPSFLHPGTLDAETTVTSVHVSPVTLLRIRTLLALYACICLFGEMYIVRNNLGIYFTDWSWLGVVIYLTTAAYNSYIYTSQPDALEKLESRSSWLKYLNWLLYALPATYAYIVSLVFWTLLVTYLLSGVGPMEMWTSISLHAGNSLIMLTELVLGRVPMAYQLIFPVIFIALLYLAESFVYHASSGGWVYPFLDTTIPFAWAFYVALVIAFSAGFCLVTAIHNGRDRRRARLGLKPKVMHDVTRFAEVYTLPKS